MELKEIIKEIIEKNGNNKEYVITKEDLIPYYYYLINCNFFNDCEVDFFDVKKLSVVEQINAKSHTMKLGYNHKFYNKVLIENFTLSPALYSPEKLRGIHKNRALISPVMYNPESFEPYKTITIWMSPEVSLDVSDEENKQFLIKKFTDVLENPNRYETPRFYHLLMKGVFQVNDSYGEKGVPHRESVVIDV